MFDDQSSHKTRSAKSDTDPLDEGSGVADEVAPLFPDPSGRSPSGSVDDDSQKTVISKRPPASSPAFRRASSPIEMGDILAGETLGHYKLEEFIGGGGMGAVFRATDTMLGRTVAVKVVSRDQTHDEALKRFRNEAQSAARLDHPNIARVHYVGEDKGWNYIVFEYIEGVNIRDLVEASGALSLEDALSYSLQIAEALHHASDRDVVHRDIKPSNILVMEDGHAKLVDMGLARLHHVESGADELTASGVTLGTFDYISPEQARDPRNTDVRGDLYSLGCTLYFMLTGEPPFADGTVLQKLLSHSSEAPPDPRAFRPDLPEEVTKVVHKLLAKMPSQRYQSPSELIAELLLLAEQLELPDVRMRAAVWIAPSDPEPALIQRHLPWVIPVMTLLIATLLLHLLSDSNGRDEIPPPRFNASAPEIEMAGSDDSQRQPAVESVDPKNPFESVEPEPGAASPSIESDDMPAATSSRLQDSTLPLTGPVDHASARQDPETTAPVDKDMKREDDGGLRPGNNVQPNESQGTQRRALDTAMSSGSELPTTKVDGESSPNFAITDVLVIASEDAVMKRNERRVATLREALQIAVALASVTTIELRFDGMRPMQPIAMDLGRSLDRELVIRGAPLCSPIIEFRTLGDHAVRDPRPAMIDVQGGYLKWQNVHFVVDLSAMNERRESWTLFRLRETVNVEFRRCTFTIRNEGLDIEEGAQKAAFFDIADESFQASRVGSQSLLLSGPTPSICLEQCIARGQATLVRSQRAIPFVLSWDHGLFVSTERLVEIGGTLVEPRWEYGRATLFCQHLIAIAGKGICLMKSDDSVPFQVGLAVNCFDSVFATRAAEPLTTLYEIRGNSPLGVEEILMDIGGSNNYYKNTNVVLRIAADGSSTVADQFTFDDLRGADGINWFNEKNPQPATLFSWPTPQLPVDQQTIETFIPPGSSEGPFTRVLEIAPSLLPELPTASKVP